MKLVIGLGNPGSKYRHTRHNAGYRVIAEVASRYPCAPKTKFHGDIVEINADLQNILLLAPTTFMNRSGLSAGEAVRFYKLPLEDVLVVCDDLNLPIDKLRFRTEGSGGGQKGLADILRVLGTEKLPRLRLGIGSPPGQMDAADYVLMNFTEKEKTGFEITVKIAADAVLHWAEHGIESAMNKYN